MEARAGRGIRIPPGVVLHRDRRIARDLLQQVVGNYLARDTATVQVLHSIKTLAMEMGLRDAGRRLDYLGELLDHHWKLNQILDPIPPMRPLIRY